MTITLKLIDSTFSHNPSMCLAGENADESGPIIWDTTPGPSRIKVFTDLRLAEVMTSDAEINLGIIVEAPAMAETARKLAVTYRDRYNIIFTNDCGLLESGAPFAFYPFGGSWIKEWGDFPKTHSISLLTSKKRTTDGHQLRHAAAERYNHIIDTFGEPYTGYLPTKIPALRPYQYSVIIENGRADYHFSEKLIDCLSQSTIPIYWGCPSIGDFFELDGILTFTDLDELGDILNWAIRTDYRSNVIPTIRENLRLAHYYRCPEAWILNTLQIRGIV